MSLAVAGTTGGSNDNAQGWPIVSVDNTAKTITVSTAGIAQAGAAGTAMSGTLTVGGIVYTASYQTVAAVRTISCGPPSFGTLAQRIALMVQTLTASLAVDASQNLDRFGEEVPAEGHE